MKLWTNAHSFFNLGMASMFQLDSSIIWNHTALWGAQRHSKQSRKTFAMKFNFIWHQWKLETKWKSTKNTSDMHLWRRIRALAGKKPVNKKPCYRNATRMAAYQFWSFLGSWHCETFGVSRMWNSYWASTPSIAQHPPHFTLKLCNYGTGNSLF